MRLAGFITATLLATLPPTPAYPQSVEEGKSSALAHATALEDLVTEMSSRLWDFAEIALEEHQSAAYLAEVLESEGFTVERGVAGMPTAFVASWGSGRPILGVLAEYDALPNIGNAVVPGRAPREDDHPHGQGCGHNLFGAASVAAAIAIKRMMADHGTAGTVRLYGTPAEETVVGKVYMARDGLFDDLDASIVWHPSQKTAVSNNRARAPQQLRGQFPRPGGPRRGRPLERTKRPRRGRAHEPRREHDARAHRAERAHPLRDPERGGCPERRTGVRPRVVLRPRHDPRRR